MNRNPSAPIFNPASYSRTIEETLAPGSSLVQLSATDADGVCMIKVIHQWLFVQLFMCPIVLKREQNLAFCHSKIAKKFVVDYNLTICLLTFFQHNLRYSRLSITPTGLEDFFYVNFDTGLITVARMLTQTQVNSIQMTFTVTDNGIPARSSNTPAIVSIQILRNQFDPFFINTPYLTSIQENVPIGTSVLTVTASDQDQVSRPTRNLISWGRLW